MGKLMKLSGAFLLACGTLAAPALAKSDPKVEDSTCHLNSYSYLVGENIVETRNLGTDYRLISAGANPGSVQPSRVTIVYDRGTDVILSVSCG